MSAVFLFRDLAEFDKALSRKCDETWLARVSSLIQSARRDDRGHFLDPVASMIGQVRFSSGQWYNLPGNLSDPSSKPRGKTFFLSFLRLTVSAYRGSIHLIGVNFFLETGRQFARKKKEKVIARSVRKLRFPLLPRPSFRAFKQNIKNAGLDGEIGGDERGTNSPRLPRDLRWDISSVGKRYRVCGVRGP